MAECQTEIAKAQKKIDAHRTNLGHLEVCIEKQLEIIRAYKQFQYDLERSK